MLDSYVGSYRELTGARDFAAYLAVPPGRADEELLTEPVLALILERVLGFPRDRYFPQYGKGGLKPDLTPHDLIAHPFVFDAKSSTEALGAHEPQIRRYITQRSLDLGVLFNLHELRVYRAGEKGHDSALSFRLLPVWQAARGEAMPGPEVEAFERFCARFAYREVDDAAKIAHVREQRPWHTRIEAGEPLTVDVEFLVRQLRELAQLLAGDAAVTAADALEPWLGLAAGREERLVRELHQLAFDVEPGVDPESLPGIVREWRAGAEALRPRGCSAGCGSPTSTRPTSSSARCASTRSPRRAVATSASRASSRASVATGASWCRTTSTTCSRSRRRSSAPGRSCARTERSTS